MNLALSLTNLELFDHVIVAEDGMDTLNEFGWNKESDTTHPTFGDNKRAMVLLAKLRWFRLFNYLKKKKYLPPEGLKINNLNKLDLELYDLMRR